MWKGHDSNVSFRFVTLEDVGLGRPCIGLCWHGTSASAADDGDADEDDFPSASTAGHGAPAPVTDENEWSFAYDTYKKKEEVDSDKSTFTHNPPT